MFVDTILFPSTPCPKTRSYHRIDPYLNEYITSRDGMHYWLTACTHCNTPIIDTPPHTNKVSTNIIAMTLLDTL